jgi:hypothetical protein
MSSLHMCLMTMVKFAQVRIERSCSQFNYSLTHNYQLPIPNY